MSFSKKCKKEHLDVWNMVNIKYIKLFQQTEIYIQMRTYLNEHEVIVLLSEIIDEVSDKKRRFPNFEEIYTKMVDILYKEKKC